jgi:hypothetical protein
MAKSGRGGRNGKLVLQSILTWGCLCGVEWERQAPEFLCLLNVEVNRGLFNRFHPCVAVYKQGNHKQPRDHVQGIQATYVLTRV